MTRLRIGALALIVGMVAMTGCGEQINVSKVESQIQADLGPQLSRAAGTHVNVAAVDCVANNKAMTARCMADVSDSTDSVRVAVSVEVDRDTGEYVWTVDQ